MSETFWGHVQLALVILVPICSGLAWVIKRQADSIRMQARMELKVDTMWEWFTNHGSHITGYKPSGEK